MKRRILLFPSADLPHYHLFLYY
ncbi:hypothetical protein NC651_001084 [Populus alba x Populus x berolinensis]|nr:hypothetical protein NC651_001084 [Populus alba x Populus x berolinensis]